MNRPVRQLPGNRAPSARRRSPDLAETARRRSPQHGRPRQAGFTLVEILIATVLMVIMMGAVAVIFGSVSEGIAESRATLEMSSRLRNTAARMKQDLEGVTVATLPPVRPESNQGYLEYVEGPIGPVVDPWNVAVNTGDPGSPADTTVGDFDDILMFTVRSKGEPFTGLVGGVVVQSQEAEIAWFVRGRTLYRRVLLVRPGQWWNFAANAAGFYAQNDISIHKDWQTDGTAVLVANSLADLTRPECRYAHNPDPRIWMVPVGNTTRAPHPQAPPISTATGLPVPGANPWRGFVTGNTPSDWLPGLQLPILAECSDPTWNAGNPLPNRAALNNIAGVPPFDAWMNPYPWDNTNPSTGALDGVFPDPVRIGEDVVLTNVVGFDVKAWDPNAPLVGSAGAVLQPGDPGYVGTLATQLQNWNPNNSVLSFSAYGAFVDLNYMCRVGSANQVKYASSTVPQSLFYHQGNRFSKLEGTRPATSPSPANYRPSIYDTWSFHYEHNQRWVRFTSGGNLVHVGNENNNGLFDEGTNGFDDDANGVVDDIGERETMPPYPVPLSGIQIKIRTFEPDSRQVREVTIVHDFLPK